MPYEYRVPIWIVRGQTTTVGPFSSGAEAAEWVDHHRNNLYGRVTIEPVEKPFPIPLRPE